MRGAGQHCAEDVAAECLAWFARQGFPKGELGQLLELMYTLDHNNLRGLLRPLKKGNGNLA